MISSSTACRKNDNDCGFRRGMIGDLAGFVAATIYAVFLGTGTYQFGRMVDAGIGGKVAVDHPRGKSDWRILPTALCINRYTDAIQFTSTRVNFRWSEVIKYGLILNVILWKPRG